MDEISNRMKGLMKNNVNVPFSSSSGKFKGSGRVLGTSSSPSPSQPSSPVSSSNFNHLPLKTNNNISEHKLENEIAVTNINSNENSSKGFECPVCAQLFNSEEDVYAHIESCLSMADQGSDKQIEDSESRMHACVSAYLSGNNSVEVMVRVLTNLVKEPENAKFRKIRLGNPKIKEAIGDVTGGVELLEYIGFRFIEENGEMWLAMEVPSHQQLGSIKSIITLLEPKKPDELSSSVQTKADEPVKPKKSIDRQIRVFFSVPEKVAAKIVLPDSFYNLSAEEIKKEAEARRKKLEDSKVLIPKSYREKQAKIARTRYKRSVIRIQFPDGVILQALFAPSERTTALYELVSSALKERSLEFDLLDPIVIKRRVIPRGPVAGKRAVTLADEDLVPSALIKFKPIETDTIVFTGLCNELLEIIEPLVPDSAVPSL